MKIIGRIPVFLLFLFFALSQSTETVFTSSLTKITADFNVSPNLVQKTSSAYFVGFALGILFFGRLSDNIGRKPTFLIGLIIYLISTIFCFYTTNIYTLIILRFIKAFGASVGSVVAQAMARDSYKGSNLASVYSILGFSLALTPSIGSIIGSNISAFIGWKYNFVFLSLYAIILFFICLKFLPETYPYVGEQSGNLKNIFKTILKDKKVLSYACLIGIYNGIFYSFYIEAPFIFINKINIKQEFYGYFVLVPLCISSSIGSLFSRYLIKKMYQSYALIKIGVIMSFISMSLYLIFSYLWNASIMSNNLAKFLILAPILSQGFSYSLIIPSILKNALKDYDKVNGTAGSIFGFMYYVLIALVNFLTTLIHSENTTKVAFMYITLVTMSIFFYRIITEKEQGNIIKPYR